MTKSKFLMLALLFAIQITMTSLTFWSFFFLLNTSMTAVEMLINALSLLMLDNLAKIGSLVYLNWLKGHHNELTFLRDFLIVKTNPNYEKWITAILWTIFTVCLLVLMIMLTGIKKRFKLFEEENISKNKSNNVLSPQEIVI